MSHDGPRWSTSYLRDNQYRDSRNLAARADLHRRFSVNRTGWHPWVVERLALVSRVRVLECGCGPGWLWRGQTDVLPIECEILCTDLSPGMVAEAAAALEDARFRFETADIEALPYDDDAFDIVVANHMLYHTTDLGRALSEVRRVLAPDGRFYAATNGAGHMKELADIGRSLAAAPNLPVLPDRRFLLSFRLDNGEAVLRQHFEHVRRYLYPDALRVTEAAPLVDYLASMSAHQQQVTPNRAQAIRVVEAALTEAGGVLFIAKESGLFEAWASAPDARALSQPALEKRDER